MGNLDLWSTMGNDTVGQAFCTELYSHFFFWIHNSMIHGYYEMCGGPWNTPASIPNSPCAATWDSRNIASLNRRVLSKEEKRKRMTFLLGQRKSQAHLMQLDLS